MKRISKIAFRKFMSNAISQGMTKSQAYKHIKSGIKSGEITSSGKPVYHP